MCVYEGINMRACANHCHYSPGTTSVHHIGNYVVVTMNDFQRNRSPGGVGLTAATWTVVCVYLPTYLPTSSLLLCQSC